MDRMRNLDLLTSKHLPMAMRTAGQVHMSDSVSPHHLYRWTIFLACMTMIPYVTRHTMSSWIDKHAFSIFEAAY